MENKEPERFTAADLSPEQLNDLEFFEKDLRSDSNKEIILVAYEEKNEKSH
ncbi:hypothetical protein [Salipaludibacillus sp. CF4.18]|uniref:hypothetical protein n=1 Tax=Salipaludibacillus sp. CF4.18 TaxID=3373081 RepID=UPI003EE72683